MMRWIIVLFFLVLTLELVRRLLGWWQTPIAVPRLMPSESHTTIAESDASATTNPLDEIVWVEAIPEAHANVVSTTDSVTERETWTTWRCNILLKLGGLTMGYVPSISGGVIALPEYQHKMPHHSLWKKLHAKQDDYCKFQDQYLLLHSSIIPLGGMVGASFTVWYKCWGRRSALIAGSFVLLLGVICMSWFPHIVVDICGQITAGFGVGLLYQVVPIICSQTLQKEARESGSTMFQTSIAVGVMVASGANFVASHFHVTGWRMSLGIVGIPITVLFITSLYMTEPPQFFIDRGELRKGKNALVVIRGTTDVNEEFQELVDNSARDGQTNSYIELLRPHNRPVLIINTLTTIFTKFMGVDVLTYYGAFLLQSLGYKTHEAFFGPFALALMQLNSQVMGVSIIRRHGRRRAYLWACLIASITMISLGIIFNQNSNSDHHFAHKRAIYATILVIVYFMACGILLSPLGWLQSTYPTNCAELGSTLSTVVKFLCTFIANQVTFRMLCVLRGHIFFLYATNSLLLFGFIHGFLPETRNIEQHQQVERVWGRHWYWRRYIA